VKAAGRMVSEEPRLSAPPWGGALTMLASREADGDGMASVPVPRARPTGKLGANHPGGAGPGAREPECCRGFASRCSGSFPGPGKDGISYENDRVARRYELGILHRVRADHQPGGAAAARRGSFRRYVESLLRTSP